MEQTEGIKYLGIILDNHITFEKAMKTLSGCGGRALAAVIKEIDSCQDLSSKSGTRLFKF